MNVGVLFGFVLGALAFWIPFYVADNHNQPSWKCWCWGIGCNIAATIGVALVVNLLR